MSENTHKIYTLFKEPHTDPQFNSIPDYKLFNQEPHTDPQFNGIPDYKLLTFCKVKGGQLSQIACGAVRKLVQMRASNLYWKLKMRGTKVEEWND